MTSSNLVNTITAILKLAADAGRVAGTLEAILKVERNPVVHGRLHRLAGACLELERHITQAMQARERHAA